PGSSLDRPRYGLRHLGVDVSWYPRRRGDDSAIPDGRNALHHCGYGARHRHADLESHVTHAVEMATVALAADDGRALVARRQRHLVLCGTSAALRYRSAYRRDGTNCDGTRKCDAYARLDSKRRDRWIGTWHARHRRAGRSSRRIDSTDPGRPHRHRFILVGDGFRARQNQRYGSKESDRSEE